MYYGVLCGVYYGVLCGVFGVLWCTMCGVLCGVLVYYVVLVPWCTMGYMVYYEVKWCTMSSIFLLYAVSVC